MDDFCAKARHSGYDGVELVLPLDETEKNLALAAIDKYELDWIAQTLSSPNPDFEHQKAHHEEQFRHLAEARPLFINTQTGKDFYDFEQNRQLIDLGLKISKETGVPIFFETHRGKFSFAAHITRTFLEKIPDLRLGLDLSHWCNVAESYLEDQPETVVLALNRTEHIHARVGFPEGPQIPDPRTEEWQDALNHHLNWWDSVIERKKKEGAEIATITPEFGPEPYMVIQPFTRQPITDQWEVNVYMKNLLDKRYN
jgi:sugar phosphate isomerase/epimerase